MTAVGNLVRRPMNAIRSTGRGTRESDVFIAIGSATLGPTAYKGRRICWDRLEKDKKVTLFESNDSKNDEEA